MFKQGAITWAKLLKHTKQLYDALAMKEILTRQLLCWNPIGILSWQIAHKNPLPSLVSSSDIEIIIIGEQ